MSQNPLCHEIIDCIVLCTNTQTFEITFSIQHHTLIPGILQREIEICSTANIFIGIDAVVPVSLI